MTTPEQVLADYARYTVDGPGTRGEEKDTWQMMEALADALIEATTPTTSKMPTINFSDLVGKSAPLDPDVEIVIDLADPKVLDLIESNWNHTFVSIQLRHGDHRQILWLSMSPVSGHYSPERGVRVEMTREPLERNESVERRDLVMRPAKGYPIPL